MAGNIRGKIECYSNTGETNNNIQEVFKGLYDFFVYLVGIGNIVARQGGSGAGAASVDYWDEADPFKTGAWFVAKMPANVNRPFPFFVLVQYHDSTQSFGASPGNPGLIFGGAGSGAKIGVQVAIGEGGDENPWNGGGSFGLNTKGDPVWKIPQAGTRRHVFPRSNNVGGTHDASKQNCVGPSGITTAARRWHVVGDDDNFVLAFDYGDDGGYILEAFLAFVPRSGLTVPYPVFLLHDADALLTITTVYGSIAGNQAASEGGLVMPITSDGMRGLVLERLTICASTTTYQPNKCFATPEYDEFPMAVLASETPTFYGYVGMMEFLREVGNIAWKDTDLARLRHMIGPAGTGTKLSMPWDGVTVPGTGVTRQGVEFTRAP